MLLLVIAFITAKESKVGHQATSDPMCHVCVRATVKNNFAKKLPSQW